jgi:hypothetical protein
MEKVIKENQYIEFEKFPLTYQAEIEESMLDVLKCTICSNICEDPKNFSCCEEIACNKCAKTFLVRNNLCPSCNSENPQIYKLGKILSDLYLSLRVNCIFDCGNVSVYSEYKNHEQVCINNPDAMFECPTCELNFSKEKLKSHDCTEELRNTLKNLKLQKEQNYSEDDETLNLIKHSLKLHKHPLAYAKRKNWWRCDFCREKYNTDDASYYCYECDFDCCKKCFLYTLDKKEVTE